MSADRESPALRALLALGMGGLLILQFAPARHEGQVDTGIASPSWESGAKATASELASTAKPAGKVKTPLEPPVVLENRHATTGFSTVLTPECQLAESVVIQLQLTPAERDLANQNLRASFARIAALEQSRTTLVDSEQDGQYLRVPPLGAESTAIRDELGSKLVEILGIQRAGELLSLLSAEIYFGTGDSEIQLYFDMAGDSTHLRTARISTPGSAGAVTIANNDRFVSHLKCRFPYWESAALTLLQPTPPAPDEKHSRR